MILCHHLDNNVKTYLEGKIGKTVVTLFKEPFYEYRGNKVIFIDDILDEFDYEKIDKFVDATIQYTRNVFHSHINVEGYNLFRYLELPAKVNLSKIYKYKCAVDKISEKEKKNSVALFASETELSQWLRKDYVVTSLSCDFSQQISTGVKPTIRTWLKSRLVQCIVDELFQDRRRRPYHLLWLGGHSRSICSELLDELRKEFKIFLVPQSHLARKFALVKRMFKYDVLKLGDYGKFNEQWRCVEQEYAKGLEKIAVGTGLGTELLELTLKINRNYLKELLRTLCILEENEGNLDLLFVEQSVLDIEGLAADYFSKRGLPSIEVLHGVPSLVTIGDIDLLGNATKVGVYGQRDKLLLIAHGMDESKIVVTGCPYYDRFFRIKKNQKSFEFLLLVLDGISFIPSSNSYEKMFEHIMSMIKLLKILGTERLLIKPHPGQTWKEELRYVQHLINTTGVCKQVEVAENVDLLGLMKKAKIVYAHSSTAGVEALLIKKPLVVLDFPPGRKIDYERYGGCLVARDFQQLVAVTNKILIDVEGYLEKNAEKIEQTRRYFSGDLDGKSYEKVAETVRELTWKH